MSKRSEISKATTIIAAWIGSGGLPVAPARAEARAQFCLACPHHSDEDWWQWKPKSKAAAIIRRTLEIKNRNEMRVSNEEALKTCAICKCCLALKVHVPLEHIQAGTTTEEFDQFKAANCWIYQESTRP